ETLRQRPPVEKVMKEIVEKEVRNPKDKFIGALGGGLLVAAIAFFIPNTPDNHDAGSVAAVAPVAPVAVSPATPDPAIALAEKEKQRLAAIAEAKQALNVGNTDAKKAAIQQLEKLIPLDSEAMRDLGLAYEMGDGVAKDAQTACNWYQQAVAAGNNDAKTYLNELRKSKKCK
ncbi:MAG: hypothetical protein PHP85_14795, partial [Gallionella sp.]|nr:hypothetical protein [Gallionella sp.]